MQTTMVLVWLQVQHGERSTGRPIEKSRYHDELLLPPPNKRTAKMGDQPVFLQKGVMRFWSGSRLDKPIQCAP
ncbi:hypothetical protein J3F84DRAFT_130665 [Trichoderma pleuroticola]